MRVNDDFSKRVVLHADEIDWAETRMKGVKRRMLDRVGAEAGRATTIVSYDPESYFSSHVHEGGEEFIVLDGVFQDEHGDFPVGSYVRNPPGSSHTPRSEDGTVIFVKLWQYDRNDNNHVRIHYDDMTPITDTGREGVKETPLYRDSREYVRIEDWAPGADIEIEAEDGAEILVLDGTFSEHDDNLSKHSWLRLPVGSTLQAKAGANGARVWIKTGHMRFIDQIAGQY